MKDAPLNTTNVLSWPNRLLSADDLRRHLTSQHELVLLPRTVITPLAADELRAKGVRITWQTPNAKDTTAPKQGTWIYAQEKHDTMFLSVVKALERDGVTLTAFVGSTRSMADAVLAERHRGGIYSCGDTATACCIANKIAGIRAACVMTNAQVLRAQKNLGANLFAIEVAGRTFFEVRQMLRTIATHNANCPNDVASLLQELDGHAHR